MLKRFFLKWLAIFTISFCYVANGANYIKADSIDSYDYDAEMSYNLFTAATWNLSIYSYFGYAFAWMPYFNKSAPYGDMLRNRHHGIVFGGGIAINKNILFGLSFQFISKVSHMRGKFCGIYKEIAGITSSVFMTNIDVGIRLPMGLTRRNLFRHYLDIYVVGGLNIISANLTNKYFEEYDMVPADITRTPHKVSLGANLGIALTYKILSGLHIRTEVRKMLILTRKLSLPSDSWLFNLGIGINF